MKIVRAVSGGILSSLVTLTPALAEEQKEMDTGTDPTRVSRSVVARYEHLDLQNGFNSDILRLKYTIPIGPRQNYSLSFEMPIAAVDVLGNSYYAMGDVILGLSHVFGLTREGGYVAKAEILFNTAERSELGSGKNVFKGSFIKAWFLSGGDIFAPALVLEESFSGESQRTDVRRTTIDFYYVPKLADPRNLVTYDPNIVHNSEADQTYGGLAITFGRVVGKAFGGNQVVFVKPTVFAGGDRPADWGLEVGYKIIGF